MTEPQVTTLGKIQAIAQGFGLLLMLHLLAIAGLWVLLYLSDLIVYVMSGVAESKVTNQLYQVWVFALLMFGLVQWLYVLPVIWWLQQQELIDPRKTGKIQGLMGGAIATSLLNGIYFLLDMPLPPS